MAQIKGRGLPTLEMFMFCDLFEEWWPKEKNNQQNRAWRKFLETIAGKKDAALSAAIDDFMEKSRKDNEALGFR